MGEEFEFPSHNRDRKVEFPGVERDVPEIKLPGTNERLEEKPPENTPDVPLPSPDIWR